MESQDSSISCFSIPAQVLEHIDLESKLQCVAQGSCGLPSLSVLEPLSQTQQPGVEFEVTTANNISYQQTQLKPTISGSDSAYDAGASCPEKFRSNWDAHSADLVAPSGEFKSSIRITTSPLSSDHNFESWKDGFSQTLTPVQLLDGFELQLSEECSKRFIIFDQTGSVCRIIFHPTLAYEVSNFFPSFAKVIEEINVRNKAPGKETISKIHAAGYPTDWDARFLAYRETMALAFTALQKTQMDGLDGMALNNFGDEFVASSVREESKSRLSCNGLSQVIPQGSESQLHEDTADLEALLSLDDDEETSTGHSPSEVTRSHDSVCMQNGMDVGTCVSAERKCKRQGCEEDEVDFIPGAIKESVGKDLWSEKCSSANAFSVHATKRESQIQPECCENVIDSDCHCKEFYGYGTPTIPGEKSFKGSASRHGQSCKAPLRQLGSTKRLRKDKIRRTVKRLRSIIPGIDCTNTAIVLDKAIQYLKSLQVDLSRWMINVAMGSSRYGKGYSAVLCLLSGKTG